MTFDYYYVKMQATPKTQAVQNNGGGGNSGYSGQERRKKEREEEQFKDDLFKLKDEESADLLHFNLDECSVNLDEEKEKFSASKWLGNVAEKLANKIVKKSNNPFQNT